MRSHIVISVLALSLALTGGALAQPQQHTPTPQERAAQEQALQAQAQAAAIHPGDDQLTCGQLQTQMMAGVNDPTVQQNMQANAQMAQAQQAQAQQELQRQQHQAPTNIIGSMISSMIPGAGWAQVAQARAQQQQQQQQYEQAQQQSMQMQQNTDAAMPQMMRGQRLYQLAQQKNCPFAQQNAGH